ncbi:MAG: hypothetical protein ACW98D_20885 [Promethearchaeota archaeon]|jgi:hypothetical protein
MELNDIELIIFSVSVSIAFICMIVGIVRGLYSARILGGGVMTMVMTWLIFISILMLAYNLIYFLGLPGKSLELKFVANIILLLVPICALRIIWGFSDYVKKLEELTK